MSCGQCSQVIPLICQQCKTSLSTQLNHTGAINPNDETESNRYYFRKEDEVLQKVLDSGNIRCPNCKYNFKKDRINMNLASKIIVITEDIVDEDTAKFIIQNKYSCSACETGLDNGIIKSDPIDIVYQPLKDVKQNITNFIEVLRNPDKYTVPEFCKYFIQFNSVQLQLSETGVGVISQKEANEQQKYISELICNAKVKYDDMIMAYNNIENCYDYTFNLIKQCIDEDFENGLTNFRNELNHSNISLFVKCFYNFQLLIFSYINKKYEEAEKEGEDKIEDTKFSKLLQFVKLMHDTFPEDVLQNLAEIINNINEYYNINDIDYSNVTVSKNDEIIEKLEKLLNNESVEFEEGKQVVLGDQIASLLTAQNTLQEKHIGFLKSIAGTKCKGCNATFIE